LTTEIDTLDAAISQYGAPDYCKIDVEGFELEVLDGLSRPVPLLSFGFWKEFREKTEACLGRLRAIGFRRFNVSYGKTQRFKYAALCDSDELLADLDSNRHQLAWGDIFETPSDALLQPLAANYMQHEFANDLERVSMQAWRILVCPYASTPVAEAGSEVDGVVCRFMTHPLTLCASCMSQGEIVGGVGLQCAQSLASKG
jgi:hypothetical protein